MVEEKENKKKAKEIKTYIGKIFRKLINFGCQEWAHEAFTDVLSIVIYDNFFVKFNNLVNVL